MEILRDDQVPPCEERWIYRETAWSNLIFGLVLAALAGFLIVMPLVFDFAGSIPLLGVCLLGAAGFGAFARLGLRTFRASLQPGHWLLRRSPEGLTLRFRSLYNRRFPADQPSAVLLRRDEIAAIGPATTILDSQDGSGDWSVTRKQRSLEIVPEEGVDLAPVKAALAHEASLRSARGVRFNHFPLTVTRDGRLRLEMRRPERVCQALAGDFPVRAEVRRERRFERLGPAQQEEHILDLLLAGDKIGAIKAARRVYGCDLSEAKRLVDELEP